MAKNKALLPHLFRVSVERWLMKRTPLPIRESIECLIVDLKEDVEYVDTGGRSARRSLEQGKAGDLPALSFDLPFKEFMRGCSSLYMGRALAESEGNISKAAGRMGMSRATVGAAARRLHRTEAGS